jgi:hypothetical protein
VSKAILVLVFLIGLLPANMLAQPTPLKLRPMTGYFLDPKYRLDEGPNFLVISDRGKFIKLFGQISKPDTPVFDFEHVLVMALPPTKEQMRLGFEIQAFRAGPYIEVYCTYERISKHKLTYTSYPIVVAAIPRYFGVSQIRFYETKKREKLLGVVKYRR